MKSAALILCLAALAPAAARADTHYYLVETLAEQAPVPADRAQARELERIYHDLEREADVDAQLVWSSDPDINAFATEVGGEKIVVVQEGLLGAMHGDRDAVAAVLGHELGHHKADHIRAGRRKQESARVLGSILGAVIGAKVGRSSGALAGAATAAAVGVGAGLVALKFNRDQELEADRLSLTWMIAAGYNPRGMLRLQEYLGAMQGKRQAAIFSTHPTSAKRYDAAGRFIAKLAPSEELLARETAPLVGSEALASAEAAVHHADEARLADALKLDATAIDAAALAPVEDVAFDDYAALSNQLLYAGPRGKSTLLQKRALTEPKLDRINTDFATRMQSNPALAQRYSVGFFRATQGRLAAHGRDLADSYELGQDLKLEPPYPLQTGAALFAAMRQRGAPNLDAAQQAKAEAEVLKPYALTFYDFLIAHNWWSRKAKIAALAGDTGVMRTYYGLDPKTQPDASGVHVGAGVTIGKNVTIGSEAAEPE